jgi:hypothetical protein
VSRGSNTIVLGSGRYVLSIPPAGVDDNTSGDRTWTAPRRSRSPAPACGPR